MKTNRYSGFTLVEMMIAMAVMAVLIMVAAPAFTDLIRNNRMLSAVYDMRAALNGARSKALAERNLVALCRSNDGEACSGEWTDGYIAFVDSNDNGLVDNPNDPDGDQVFISRVVESSPLALMKYSSGDPDDAVANRVRFDSRGYARGFSGTFTLCDDRGAALARGLIVTPGGNVRAAADPNDPNIAVDGDGNALDCD